MLLISLPLKSEESFEPYSISHLSISLYTSQTSKGQEGSEGPVIACGNTAAVLANTDYAFDPIFSLDYCTCTGSAFCVLNGAG